ncbi:MAG TPA: V-type ATP synthase subunit D [Candidatus Dormibacteraeota bacterium]|nr:V-type ATP synthase subunit D [Candidatus Dormibacteraeota bacterium]
MPLRQPPGRSGRAWLARRLAIATRAAALLDQKRLSLLAEERRLAAEAGAALVEWERTARAAERWALRAAVLAGERQVGLVQAHTRRPAEVDVRWRTWMGVTYPAAAEVHPGRPGPSALGGTAALDVASVGYAAALEAGVRHATLSRAHELVRAELAATTARERALERRWVPLLMDALRRLDAALDEQERGDAVRARWLRVGSSLPPPETRDAKWGERTR